jgi:hypothetical protein
MHSLNLFIWLFSKRLLLSGYYFILFIERKKRDSDGLTARPAESEHSGAEINLF